MTAELVERVYAPGDDCGQCGEALEPGDLAVWTTTGRIHESCERNTMTETLGPVGSTIVTWRQAAAGGTYEDDLYVDIETAAGVPCITVDTNGALFTAAQARVLADLLLTAAERLETFSQNDPEPSGDGSPTRKEAS